MRDASTPSTHRPRRALRAFGLGAVLGIVLAGCGASGSSSDAGPTTTKAAPSATTVEVTDTTADAAGAEGDCPSTDAMAEVLGAAVRRSSSAGAVGSSDGLSYSVAGCDYDRTDGAGSASVGRITLADAPEGAPFDLLQAEAEAAYAEEGFEPLPDLGDEAYRRGTEVAVLHGSKLFFVTAVAPIDGDGTDVLAQAEALAPALLDLDLTTDTATLCPLVEAAVADAVGPAEKTVTVRGTTGVDDVSIDTTGCSTTLADGGVVSLITGDGSQWDDWVAARQASDLSASYAEAAVGERSAFDTDEALVVDDGDEPLQITTDDLDLDPDAAADVRLQIADLVLG